MAISESPVARGVIWVGTDDGNIQVTKDAGKTWTNVVGRIKGLPANSWVPAIDASAFDAGTAYVAVDRHRDNDFAPHAYKTTDYGQTWTDISSNLPAKGYVHVVREDPKTKGLLFLGTELGIFASPDDGKTWMSLRNGLPAMPVEELRVHPRDGDLILGTHGRGIYILDDITPIRQLAAAIATDAYLFDPRPAIRWQTWGRDGNLAQKEFIGQNPPAGAIINFYLKAPAGPVTLSVANSAGSAVRTITVANPTAGVNRAVWDLRFDPPSAGTGARGRGGATPGGGGGAGAGGGAGGGDEAAPAGGRGGRGGGGSPYALPGSYVVTLKAGAVEMKKPLRVDMDPRIQVAPADLQAQLDAGLNLRDLSNRITQMIEQADDLIRELTSAASRTDASAARAKTLLDQAKALRFRMGRLPGEQNYRIQGRLREDIQSLLGSVTAVPGPLTAGEKVRVTEVKGELDKLNAEWQVFLGTVKR